MHQQVLYLVYHSSSWLRVLDVRSRRVSRCPDVAGLGLAQPGSPTRVKEAPPACVTSGSGVDVSHRAPASRLICILGEGTEAGIVYLLGREVREGPSPSLRWIIEISVI